MSLLDEKNNRIEEIVLSLREKHGDKYNTIQYRLWAEMIDVGTHKYVDCETMVHATLNYALCIFPLLLPGRVPRLFWIIIPK